MTNRGYFKKFVKSALEVVQIDIQEEVEHNQRFNKIIQELKNPQYTEMFLYEPYSTALSAVCAGIQNEHLQPVERVLQAAT